MISAASGSPSAPVAFAALRGGNAGFASSLVASRESARAHFSAAAAAATVQSASAASPGPSAFAGLPATCAAATAAVAAAALRRSGRSGLRAGRRSRCRAVAVGASEKSAKDVGVILLSAGSGKRLGAKIPKQYLKLLGLEICLHSLDTFLDCGVGEIVIVCAEEWRSIFQDHLDARGGIQPVIKFASGGAERQDSVKNGLAVLSTELVAVHDAARPLVTKAEVEKVIADARDVGAALLAVPTKATIKQGSELVSATPDRATMWEAHTPQVIRTELLRRGFVNAEQAGLEVTDDVSLVEFLGEPVKLTQGEYTNMKVTTPEDMAVAEAILRDRGWSPPAFAT
eukprot:TRINITY_DN66466_c0_g1_i1.p1 TRINITY_DN66466_c0_g1~~TRINITY_DN66466_c0_g1_i1.p1  ORF type:complete len:368 (+),score=101.18 TRINITY_DN66466_c0_g1_i1:81-1106(+)